MNQEMGPIFISGRFRSGTSALWRVFDELPEYGAYYEPCHDNLLGNIHHTRPSPDHRGISDYWAQYRPIMLDVERCHQRCFGTARLRLERDDSYPELESYLRMLIDRAYPQRAVLQFNRMDFRLPWLAERFPEATIVHLKRNARNTWVSSRRHLSPDQWNDPLETDAFDLMQWCATLCGDFPFLVDPSKDGYSRHYQLAILSEVMGRVTADVTLEFEADLLNDLDQCHEKLRSAGVLDNRAHLEAVLDSKQQSSWSDDRPNGWFEQREQLMDAELSALGLSTQFGTESLLTIRKSSVQAWQNCEHTQAQFLIETLLEKLSFSRSEQTRMLDHLNQIQVELDASSDSNENPDPA